MRRRAFSLIEVLMMAALTLWLVGIVYTLLVPMIKRQVQSAARMQIREEGLMASRHLLTDLDLCTAGGIGLFTGNSTPPPFAMSLHTIRDTVPEITGKLVPQARLYDSKLLVYYWLPAAGKLYQRTYPRSLADPATAVVGTLTDRMPFRPATPAAWSALMANPAQDRRIASNVSELSVTSPTAGRVGFPLRLHLRIEQTGPSGEMLRFDVDRDVLPANVR